MESEKFLRFRVKLFFIMFRETKVRRGNVVSIVRYRRELKAEKRE